MACTFAGLVARLPLRIERQVICEHRLRAASARPCRARHGGCAQACQNDGEDPKLSFSSEVIGTSLCSGPCIALIKGHAPNACTGVIAVFKESPGTDRPDQTPIISDSVGLPRLTASSAPGTGPSAFVVTCRGPEGSWTLRQMPRAEVRTEKSQTSRSTWREKASTKAAIFEAKRRPCGCRRPRGSLPQPSERQGGCDVSVRLI